MRRRQEAGEPVPERLARFVPSEWPDWVREWKTASLAWLGSNPSRRLPLGEHGDGVDVLRAAVRHVRAGGLV